MKKLTAFLAASLVAVIFAAWFLGLMVGLDKHVENLEKRNAEIESISRSLR